MVVFVVYLFLRQLFTTERDYWINNRAKRGKGMSERRGEG